MKKKDKLLFRRLRRIFFLILIWIITQPIAYFILKVPNTLIWFGSSSTFVFVWIIIDLLGGSLDDEIQLMQKHQEKKK